MGVWMLDDYDPLLHDTYFMQDRWGNVTAAWFARRGTVPPSHGAPSTLEWRPLYTKEPPMAQGSGTATVHCPVCGTPVEIIVTPTTTRYDHLGKRLIVDVVASPTAHAHPDPTQDAEVRYR